MPTFVNDTFTVAISAAVSARNGEVGAVWAKHVNSGSGVIRDITGINRVRVGAGGGTILYYASGIPETADYEVSSPVFVASVLAGTNIGIAGRIDLAANTYYYLMYAPNNSAWQLWRSLAGVQNQLGTFAQILSPGQSYKMTLRMVGPSISVWIDDDKKFEVIDTLITAPGRVGIRAVGQTTDTTGFQLDSVSAIDTFIRPMAFFQAT